MDKLKPSCVGQMGSVQIQFTFLHFKFTELIEYSKFIIFIFHIITIYELSGVVCLVFSVRISTWAVSGAKRRGSPVLPVRFLVELPVVSRYYALPIFQKGFQMVEAVSGTPRLYAVGIGIGLVVLISAATPYNEMMVRGSRLGLSSLTPAAFFVFLVWVLIVNPLLKTCRTHWGLRRCELLLVFAMMMVATAIPTRGVTGPLLSMITGTQYYASAENGWADLLFPHLKPWMVARGEVGLRHFFEGVPSNERADWSIWFAPLMAWGIFFLALWTAVMCLMVLFRRQWMERERLTYPVMQVPLAMVAGSDQTRFPRFFRDPLVWVGFSIPFVIGSWGALHYYFPTFPAFGGGFPSVSLFRGAVSLQFRSNLLMLGFAYLVNTRVSLSLWVFYLIKVCLFGVFSVLGVSNNEQLGEWTDSGPVGPIFAHQGMGAMFVLVGFGLWAGRQHLASIWMAVKGRGPREDQREMMSYRRAFWGLVGGVSVMIGWLWQTGIPFWIASALVGVAFVIFVALTRSVTDGGLATIVPAIIPLGFTLSAFGSESLGLAGVVAIGFTLIWCGDLLTFMMVPMAHSVRIADEAGEGKNRFVWALLLAMGISLLVSVLVTIWLGHLHGAANLHPQYFQGFAQFPAEIAANKLRNPTLANGGGWMWTGVGMAVMALLSVVSYRYAWWPLSPLGYMVSPAWIMNALWFPFFVAWILKSLMLRFGSLTLYNRSRFLVYGVILGQIGVAGFWLVIDLVTGTTGNRIPVY